MKKQYSSKHAPSEIKVTFKEEDIDFAHPVKSISVQKGGGELPGHPTDADIIIETIPYHDIVRAQIDGEESYDRVNILPAGICGISSSSGGGLDSSVSHYASLNAGESAKAGMRRVINTFVENNLLTESQRQEAFGELGFTGKGSGRVL